MTTITDQFLMFAAVFVLAYLAYRIKERLFPSMSAEESGYAPGSEAPPWGWPVAIMLGLAVGGLLLFGPYFVVKLIGT